MKFALQTIALRPQFYGAYRLLAAAQTPRDVALALTEKIEGNGAPFAEIMAHCPPAPEGYYQPDQYCFHVTRSLLRRMTDLVPKSQHPPAVAEILTGKAVAPATIVDRLHMLQSLMTNNWPAAESELKAIVATPDAPEWAKNDAVFLLSSGARYGKGNPAQELAMVDCYLARRGATLQPMTAERWQQLLVMEPPAAEKRFIVMRGYADCAQHDGRFDERIDDNLECLAEVLQRRLVAGSRLQRNDVVRETNEWLASLVLKSGRGMQNLARMLTIGAPNEPNEEARQQVQQYVAQLPAGDAFIAERSAPAVRQQTKRVSAPWSESKGNGLSCR